MAGNSDFIHKTSRSRRWGTNVLETQVRIQVPFILKMGEGVVGCSKLLGARILVLAAVGLGQVMMFP